MSETGILVSRVQQRAATLAAYGARPCEMQELLRYTENAFDLNQARKQTYPLPDEPSVQAWTLYAEEATRLTSLAAIYKYLPQLQFPIRQGLAELPQYLDAVARGHFTYPGGAATGIALAAPGDCKVIIYPTAAGRIPVIIAGLRCDFVDLVRAFTRKGAPASIPDSMGAVIIGGYNNFHRIHLMREAYLSSGMPASGWNDRFQEIKRQKPLYQDRFIILGPGAYSGVPASHLHLEEEEWKAISLVIRLEHECTHYFTRRVFGSMQNNLLDELIADYCGLDKALGRYEADWALHFLGLEHATQYRPGARLENYRGTPPLSSGAFVLLASLVRGCIANLQHLNLATVARRGTEAYRAASVLTLGYYTLEELAAASQHELVKRFDACLAALFERWGPADPQRMTSLSGAPVLPANQASAS